LRKEENEKITQHRDSWMIALWKTVRGVICSVSDFGESSCNRVMRVEMQRTDKGLRCLVSLKGICVWEMIHLRVIGEGFVIWFGVSVLF
jgi:predicted small integral membrane protein